MSDLLDSVFDGFEEAVRIKKRIDKLEKMIKETVIAPKEPIKGTDDTVSPPPISSESDSNCPAEVIDLEECGDGVYRPKKPKLEEK